MEELTANKINIRINLYSLHFRKAFLNKAHKPSGAILAGLRPPTWPYNHTLKTEGVSVQ